MSHFTHRQWLLNILALVLLKITSTTLNNTFINTISSFPFTYFNTKYVLSPFCEPISVLGNWEDHIKINALLIDEDLAHLE